MLALPYGTSHLAVRIAATDIKRIDLPVSTPRSDALETLAEDPTLEKFLDAKTLCLVNDATRPTRTCDIVRAAGLEGDLLIATGAHSKPSPAEIRRITGDSVEPDRVSVHSATESPCTSFGTTRRGTPVFLNSKIHDYDRILIIGSVEPHYFAGYTGGRKGILPGIAAYRTIEANHALYFQPGAKILQLDANPVHEDMVEAAGMLEVPIFTINMVLDATNEILDIFCGELEPCHENAASLARSSYVVPFDEKTDTIITCAHYPMDVDLYQAQKALYSASLAVKPGGTIILVSQCRNGIGPRAFYDLMSSFSEPASLIDYAREHYQLGFHKAANFAEIQQDFRVVVVSELSASTLESIHLEACAPAQIGSLIQNEIRAGHSIACMPQGSITVPAPSAGSDSKGPANARS